MTIAPSTISLRLDTTADWHTHSDWSVGQQPPAALLAGAAAAGLHTLGLTDRVDHTTTWVAEYVRSVRALTAGGVRVRCAVETALADLRGGLDLPEHLPRLDYMLIAHHHVPGAHGPVPTHEVIDDLARGRRTAESVVADLVTATVAAVRTSPFPPVVGNLFGVLAACGLSPDAVTAELLDRLVRGLRSAQAAVVVNERSGGPAPHVVAALADGGVRLVAGSGARRADEVGRWRYVDGVATALNR